MDGELLFVDITGNGNDMTLRNPETSGGATYVDGEDDSYLYSSSDSSVLFQPNSRTEYRYFQTGDDAPINSNEFTDGYTVEAFISMTPGTPNTSILILAHPVEGMIDGDVGAKLGITNLNEVQWKSAGADDVEGWSNWSGEIFKNNNWYHLAVVNNTETATVEVFINGNPILRNRSGSIHNGINAGTSRSGPWIIGGGGNFQDTNSFHGRIGEVRITEGALPQEQWLTGRGNVEAPEPAIAAGQLAVAEHSGLVSYTYESDAESGELTSATPATITAENMTVTATAAAGYTLGVEENGQRVETISWTLVNDAYEEPTDPEEPAAPGVGNGFYISNSWDSTSVDAAFSYGRATRCSWVTGTVTVSIRSLSAVATPTTCSTRFVRAMLTRSSTTDALGTSPTLVTGTVMVAIPSPSPAETPSSSRAPSGVEALTSSSPTVARATRCSRETSTEMDWIPSPFVAATSSASTTDSRAEALTSPTRTAMPATLSSSETSTATESTHQRSAANGNGAEA